MEYHRRNLYILCITIFLAAVSWSQVLPFLPLFLKEMGVAGDNLRQWSGAVFAAQSLASIITLPFWGKMGDKYGQKQMTIRAGIFLVCIYFAMSFCRQPWELAVLRFLNGALTGFIPGSIALIATNTPKPYASRSVATAQTSAAAGQIVGPAIGGLLAALIGYRGSMQISGIAVFISTIMVWRFVKVTNKPEPAEKTSLMEDFAISLRSPVLKSAMLAVMLYSVFIAGVQPLLTLHLGDIGGNAPMWLTGAIFALPSVAFLLSAHRWTRIGERKGNRWAIYAGMTGAAVCALLLALAHNIWMFAFVFFLAGLCLSSINPLAGAIVCTRVDENFRGRAYGMLYSAGTLGAFIAPLAAGTVSAAFNIPAVFALIALTFFIGAILFRVLARRWDTVPISSQT